MVAALPARLVRAVLLDNVTRPLAHAIAAPEVRGAEMLELVEAPAIFVANHASHVDTGLLLSILPRRFRHKTVVAAAADYFFDRRWKAHALGPRSRGHPHRAAQGEPEVGRHRRRPARGGLEPDHLPRGWPVARRLVPGVHRGAPPIWPGGRAGPSSPSTSKGPGGSCPRTVAVAAEPDPDQLRDPAFPGRR
jgi:hypothetical protein